MEAADLFFLSLKCAALFILGAACFDIVHYLLHVFERSQNPFLKWLGGFHSVHHDFLDRQMQIQRKYSRGNLILHVIPEYLTAVIGVAVLGSLFFGWLPAVIVILIRTVMVVVYLFQKGEDFTHAPLSRINAQRSLLFVGPNYHALHHVYPYQYYSSFVNIFDMVFGTNFQIQDRRFLFLGKQSPAVQKIYKDLARKGGHMTTESDEKHELNFDKIDVLVISPHEALNPQHFETIENFKRQSSQRLVPAEVWVVQNSHGIYSAEDRRMKAYLKDRNVIFRIISSSNFSLFFIRRGFQTTPAFRFLFSKSI